MAQVFQRKVYPEDSIMEREIHSSMTDPKNSQANSTGLTSEKVSTCNEASKPWIQYELGSSDSAKNGEHWIKTDEDCKFTIIRNLLDIFISKEESDPLAC